MINAHNSFWIISEELSNVFNDAVKRSEIEILTSNLIKILTIEKPALLRANGSLEPLGFLFIIKKPVNVSILSTTESIAPKFVLGKSSDKPLGL